MGTRNDDISLKLAKAVKMGFLPDVSDSEVDILTKEAQELFSKDATLVSSAFQDIIGRIRTNIQDVSILIYSDSTAQMTNSWARQLPTKLATLFPTHTISFRDWVDGTPGSYNSATTIPGTGTKTIHVWEGGAAGKNWQYHYDISRREILIVTPNPDLVIFSLGHNENFALAQVGNMQTARDRAVNYIESVRSLVPSASIVLMSQNPLTAADRDKASQFRSDMYRRIAMERGYGFIDICQAFIEDGRTLAGILISGDGIHPTDTGHTLWVNEVAKHFYYTPNSQPIPLATPAFYASLQNIAPNSNFTDFTPPAAPTSWSGSNITWTKDTVNYETGTYSLQVDKIAATSTSFQADLPLNQVKGQWVTVAVRMWIPAGVTSNAGRIGIVTNSGNTLSDIWNDVDDQWFWRTVTARVSPTATYARIDISLDTSTAATSTIKIDRVVAVLGRYPSDS